MSLQDFVTRAKLGVQHMVQKVGFFGILACASVRFSSFLIFPHFSKQLSLLVQNKTITE